MKKTIAIILSLVLLLGCLPFAAADGVREPDFDGLIEQGSTAPDTNAFFVTCDLRFAPFYYTTDLGYAEFCCCYDNTYAVYDWFGNLLWKLPSNTDHANGYYGGFVAASIGADGCQIYSASGKRLSDHNHRIQYDITAYATEKRNESILIVRACENLETHENEEMLFCSSGKTLVAEEFGYHYLGMITYKKDGLWGAVDGQGNEVLPNVYRYLDAANDGLLACRKEDKYGVIDAEGNEVVPFVYDDMEVLKNGDYRRISVCKDGKWGVIDLTGKVRVPLEYDRKLQGADYKNLGKEQYEFYSYRLSGTVYDLVCEDHAVCYMGSYRIPMNVIVDTKDRFYVKETNASSHYSGVNQDGEPIPGLEWVANMTMLGDCYYMTYYDKAQGVRGGRIYDLDMKLLAEIPRAATISMAHAYIPFAWSEDLIAIQQIDYAAVSFYTHEGELVREEISAYLMRDLHHKTFSLRKKTTYSDAYAFGDGYSMTPYDFDAVGYFDKNQSDGYPLVTAMVTPETGHIYDCKGNQVSDLSFLQIDSRTDGRDYGCMHVRTWEKSGFLYICPIGTSFVDNVGASWYRDSVEFCSNAGLMNGMGGGKFQPQTVMTRAMLVRVLYNLSGTKCASHGFADVPEGKWYTDAINWAAENGIVNGTDATHFAPDLPVTREQMVTILYRYASKFAAFDVNEDAYQSFDDAQTVSGYAKAAMGWAVASGLINGKGGNNLVPRGQATRAEIATVLTRFVKFMANPPTDPTPPQGARS